MILLVFLYSLKEIKLDLSLDTIFLFQKLFLIILCICAIYTTVLPCFSFDGRKLIRDYIYFHFEHTLYLPIPIDISANREDRAEVPSLFLINDCLF